MEDLDRWDGVFASEVDRRIKAIHLAACKPGLSGDLADFTSIDALTNLSELERLDLSFNSFAGAVPPTLGRCLLLTQLNLRNNELGGELKEGKLELLTNLRELKLSGNKFVGSLPQRWSVLRALEVLDVSYNKLTGDVPGWLGELHNLKQLDLSANRL